MGKIQKDLILNGKIECPLCKVQNNLIAWEDFTIERCDSREKRRAYISLELDKAYKKKTDTLYICPNCRNYIEGYKLKIKVDEPS